MSDLARLRVARERSPEPPDDCIFLAMGLAQMNNTEEARNWLKLAEKQLQGRFLGMSAKFIMSSHRTKLELQILVREAKQLLVTNMQPADENERND